MTTDVSIETLRETVETINTMIIRLQELKETSLTLIHKMEPPDLTESIPKLGRIYLAPREISIVKLVGQGRSNREIAVTLNLKESYIKNTISRLYDKLEVNDRGGLVLYAIRSGIVTVNQ